MMQRPDREKLWDILRTCYDPEIPINIVDLGLVYSLNLDDGRVRIAMTLTAPGCPMSEVIRNEVEQKIAAADGVNHVEVELTFDPPWDPSRMSEAARLEAGMM